MHDRAAARLHPQRTASAYDACLVGRGPDPVTRLDLLTHVTLVRLIRHVEDHAVVQRAHQLHILGVRPREWHRATSRTAIEKFALRRVIAIPDLFGEHAAVTGLRPHDAEQAHSRFGPTPRELVMRALAGDQWPAAANAHAVVRRAVFVLPVAVVVVSVPGRSRLCAAADQCIDDAHRVSYSL